MDQVDPAVGALDEQLHQRVLEHVAGQHRPDPGIEQRRRATDTHQALRLGAIAFDQFGGAFRLHPHGQAALVIGLADFRQGAMPAGAVQQAHAEAFFKLGNASAELRLGHVQCPAGCGETVMLHHLGEVVEGVEVFHHRSPNRTLKLIFAV
ncbi:hypothetical protein D3C80_801550 [compost metagenome]